jgi:hypothetical protein
VLGALSVHKPSRRRRKHLSFKSPHQPSPHVSRSVAPRSKFRYLTFESVALRARHPDKSHFVRHMKFNEYLTSR